VEVVVFQGGTLAGKVIVQGMDPGQIEVLVRSAEQRGDQRIPIQGPRLSPEGTFEISGLGPGEHSVSLLRRELHRWDSGVEIAGRVLGTVRAEVRSGETARVSMDLTALAPGTVRGRVFLDGEPLTEGRVIARESEGKQVPYGEFLPDKEGRFTADGILPGSYRIGASRTSNSGFIFTHEILTIGPGQEITRDFHLIRQVLRVRLLHAGGSPIRSTQVDLLRDRSTAPRQTDEEGWLILDPVSPGPFRIRLGRDDSNGTVLGPIKMPADKKEAVFELKVGRR
jgi:hypothetical protein